MESVVGMHSPFLAKELADVFAEESETDGAFYGFSDHEKGDLNDQNTDSENGFETKSEPNLQKKRPSSKRQDTQTFKLRIVLRSRTSTEDPTEEDSGEEREVEDERKSKKRKHVRFEEETAVAQPSPFKDSGSNLHDESRKSKKAKRGKPVKFEEEETAVAQPSPFKDSKSNLQNELRKSKRGKPVKFEEEETAVAQPSPTKHSEANLQDESRKSKKAKRGKHVKFEEERAVACPSPSKDSDSNPEDESFLAKRAQNIMANKAMLAQLMADLQKMPGGAGLLKKQAAKQPKQKSVRPPRSAGESKKNPERVARRQTRSMGSCDSPAPQETELELSLEEELCEVRRAPRSRGAPRPNASKPHVIRPVSDITEHELQRVADATTVKVYNSATGSTCHQCRQKTIDTKTCCRSEDCRGIQGQFCGPCLRNRYGEDVKTALLDPEWQCPPCRGICNCSFCRAREGRCPTGILLPLAQYHGFSDVHSYLTSLRNKLNGEEAEDS